MKFKWLDKKRYTIRFFTMQPNTEYDTDEINEINDDDVKALKESFPKLVKIVGEKPNKKLKSKTDPDGDGFHTCNECGKEFDTPQGLASHKRIHE